MKNNTLTLGLKKSEEEKAAISERMRDNKHGLNRTYVTSEETKQKISKANKGKKPWLGRKHTEESRRKMSLAKIGNKNRKKKPDANTNK